MNSSAGNVESGGEVLFVKIENGSHSMSGKVPKSFAISVPVIDAKRAIFTLMLCNFLLTYSNGAE